MKELPLDINTFNSYMKVQMTCGREQIVKSFSTFNDAVSKVDANIGSYGLLLRACSILGKVDVAEEIYTYTNVKYKAKTSEPIGISFYNAMLDCYAEANSPLAFSFFADMLNKKMPVNGGTFNAYAKACIFQDERIKLIEMVELMRVEGVLQMELSKPVRHEIYEAQTKYSMNNKNRTHFKIADDLKKQGIDYFEQFRGLGTIGQIPWGRHVDIHSPELMELLTPYIEKYTVPLERFNEPAIDLEIVGDKKPKLPRHLEEIYEPNDPLMDALIVN